MALVKCLIREPEDEFGSLDADGELSVVAVCFVISALGHRDRGSLKLPAGHTIISVSSRFTKTLEEWSAVLRYPLAGVSKLPPIDF